MKKFKKDERDANVAGATLLGVFGIVLLAGFCALFFMDYGGNHCSNNAYISPPDQNGLVRIGSCDCFCCNWFGLQGYEACGQFGFWLGIVLGVILLIWIISRLRKFDGKKKS